MARSSRQDCLAPLGRSRFLWAADGTRGRVDDISAAPTVHGSPSRIGDRHGATQNFTTTLQEIYNQQTS